METENLINSRYKSGRTDLQWEQPKTCPTGAPTEAEHKRQWLDDVSMDIEHSKRKMSELSETSSLTPEDWKLLSTLDHTLRVAQDEKVNTLQWLIAFYESEMKKQRGHGNLTLEVSELLERMEASMADCQKKLSETMDLIVSENQSQIVKLREKQNLTPKEAMRIEDLEEECRYYQEKRASARK